MIKDKDTISLKEAKKVVKVIKKYERKKIRGFSFSWKFPFINTFLFWEFNEINTAGERIDKEVKKIY